MRSVSEITLQALKEEKGKAFMNYGQCDDLMTGISIYKKLVTRINKRRIRSVLDQFRKRR